MTHQDVLTAIAGAVAQHGRPVSSLEIAREMEFCWWPTESVDAGFEELIANLRRLHNLGLTIVHEVTQEHPFTHVQWSVLDEPAR